MTLCSKKTDIVSIIVIGISGNNLESKKHSPEYEGELFYFISVLVFFLQRMSAFFKFLLFSLIPSHYSEKT